MRNGPKQVALVTLGRNTRDLLARQLSTYLGEDAVVTGHALEDGVQKTISADLIVISSREIAQEVERFVDPACRRVIGRRSVNHHELDKLLAIPAGSDVLLVNDRRSTTLDTISGLQALGIDHLRYVPYYPGVSEIHRIELAVTPGEEQLVPDFVKRVINIQPRSLDFSTLYEVSRALDIPEERMQQLSATYLKDIIELIKRARLLSEANRKVNNQLEAIINTVHDGIVALDEKDCVSVFNHIAEEIFCLSRSEVVGRQVTDPRFDADAFSALSEGAPEGEKFAKVCGRRVVVNTSTVQDGEKNVFTVHTLKDVTEIQRLEEELRRRLVALQHCARYTFDQIHGESEVFRTAKDLARKIADSHSHVLIQGESGTGKELFAHAVHIASPRKHGPFVAVNFAALPESLLESELFGYEEGAFTGAKKGGNPGLFEQAHRGTVFLDEIGDAPVSFQIRLLRVLQEKQLRRIGSARQIPVDVRVISATNKDLKDLIARGQFRQDLYYRLNVLPLKIPALRQRGEDILRLARVIYGEYFAGRPPVPADEYFSSVGERFLAYSWPGNIRELRNVIEYLTNVSPDAAPSVQQLPEEIASSASGTPATLASARELSGDRRRILLQIAEANRAGGPIGRRSLASRTGLSEAAARKHLADLEREGYVNVWRGVKGVRLSSKGWTSVGSL
jgi:PAS domain S-box-containing protein